MSLESPKSTEKKKWFVFAPNPVKCHLTYHTESDHQIPVRKKSSKPVPKPQGHRLIRERSFMIIRGRFYRHMSWCGKLGLHNRTPLKVVHEVSHPSPSPSICVSRQRSFTPIRNQKSPYQDFLHSEVHVRRLGIRIVSQSVVRVHSVDFGSCCLVRVCFFTDSSLVVPLYISFCIHHLSNRHMMGVHVWVSPTSVFIIVLEWHLLPSTLAFFYSDENKFSLCKPW